MSSILPLAETQFCDALGVPLAGGTVAFYAPGTTTPKDTWSDFAQTILNSNPILLDSAGRALIVGSGSYRQVVKDANGNLIWDQTTAEPVTGAPSFGGTSTGTANAQIVSAGTFTGADGSQINFIAGFTNTSSVTLQVGASGSPIPVLKNSASGPINLVAGDITAGNAYSVAYSVSLGIFQLLQSLPAAIVIASQADAQAGTNNTNVMTPLRTNQAIQALGTPAPSVKVASWPLRYNAAGSLPEYVHPINMAIFSGLKIQSINNTQVTVTGSLGLSVTADITVSGANGLDTGIETISTWYHVWVIWNGATAAGLLSTSSTSPTMPAGYTNKVRVGVVRNDASGNFWRTIQYGRSAQVVIGTNPLVTPLITNGNNGTVNNNSPTLVSISLAAFVPPTACKASLYLYAGYGGGSIGTIIIAPNTAFGGTNNGPNGSNGQIYPLIINNTGGYDSRGLAIGQKYDFVLEAISFGLASAGAAAVGIGGWEDNI